VTEPAASPSHHVVLVGLPGAGKSTVGRALAKRLGLPFLDLDQLIADRAGRSVVEIFAEQGEPAFRALEVEVTRELAGQPPAVLAPGGGWVTNPGVMALLRPPARIIHLRIRPGAALARLRRARHVRPLLETADPLATINRLWRERRALYEQADAVVDVERVKFQQLMDTVVALARGGPDGVG
jgi:shikimate kinase